VHTVIGTRPYIGRRRQEKGEPSPIYLWERAN